MHRDVLTSSVVLLSHKRVLTENFSEFVTIAIHLSTVCPHLQIRDQGSFAGVDDTIKG